MLIVMLNFIIAEVGDTYNTVKEQGISLLNKQKLELNNLVFQIQDLFGLKNQFRCIVYQAPHVNVNADEAMISKRLTEIARGSRLRAPAIAAASCATCLGRRR
jgi:hypothetical protein